MLYFSVVIFYRSVSHSMSLYFYNINGCFLCEFCSGRVLPFVRFCRGPVGWFPL